MAAGDRAEPWCFPIPRAQILKASARCRHGGRGVVLRFAAHRAAEPASRPIRASTHAGKPALTHSGRPGLQRSARHFRARENSKRAGPLTTAAISAGGGCAQGPKVAQQGPGSRDAALFPLDPDPCRAKSGAPSSAVAGAAVLGFDFSEMVAIVMSLTSTDFYKSMTTHADHRVWQDVYRPRTRAGEVYLKLTVIDDVLIVSFKEL
ncbi:Motility quorum-sensing regulator, toxin of MqsA [compost metagenome]